MNKLVLTRKDLKAGYYYKSFKDISIAMFGYGFGFRKIVYESAVIIFIDNDFSWKHLKNRYGSEETHLMLETLCKCMRYHKNFSSEPILVCPFCNLIWIRPGCKT